MNKQIIRWLVWLLAAGLLSGCLSSGPAMPPLQTKWQNARNKGDALLRECQMDLALTAYRNAYVFAELRDDRLAMAYGLLTLGSLHITRGDWAMAQDRLQQARMRFEVLEDPLGLIQTGLNEAALALKKNNYQAAFEQYQALSQLLEQTPDASDAFWISLYNGMAMALKNLGRSEEAAGRLAEAESLAVGQEQYRSQLAMIHLNQARLHLDQKRLAEAYELVAKALDLDRAEENLLGVAADLVLLAMIAQQRGERADADRLYAQAGRIRHFCGLDQGLESTASETNGGALR